MADIQFEHIDPYVEGSGGDTGLTSRQKLRRNFEKIKAWMDSVASSLASWFLRKDQPDTARETITFQKGAKFGTYTTGPLGTGGAVVIDQAGNSTAEFDYITIRKAATFRELTIKELRHVGGEIVLSAAAMKCSKVEPLDPNMQPIAADSPMVACFKCYFDTNDADGNQQVFQEFVEGDLARCQTFGSSVGGSIGYTSTRYYWRKVLAVGEDYIILGNGSGDKDDDCTSAPAVGDNIVQLGYVGNDKPYRQSAIILSATDTDAPSMKFYQGINSFTLPTPVKDEGYNPSTGVFHCNIGGDFFAGDANGHISYDSVNHQFEVKGKVQMTANSTVGNTNINEALETLAEGVADAAGAASDAQSAADDAQSTANAANTAAGNALTAANNANTAINGLSTGNENLVVNGGFTGLYESESVESNTTVNSDTDIFSNPWGRWSTHSGCSIVTAVASATGVACKMQSGTLTQTISRGIKSGKPYTLSVLGIASGTITAKFGNTTIGTLSLSAGQRSQLKITPNADATTLTLTGSGTLTEISLIQGNVTINDWTPSPEDNNKFLSYYKNFAYLMAAIEQADTQILGGLVLTQQIRVGNYADHVMTQETGGMNGDRETDDSPFLWGGGSMTQAISTIAAYANDPTYQPTQQELANMAKFVVTHGGRAILNDIIMRGLVYATGGKFTGQDGLYRMELNADNRRFSVFGPNKVVGIDNLTPVSGATEVEYIRIGDFYATTGSQSTGYRVEPKIKMKDATGNTRISIDNYNGVVLEADVQTQGGQVENRATILSRGYLFSDANNFKMILKGLPDGQQSLEDGQIYVDNNGFLKIYRT